MDKPYQRKGAQSNADVGREFEEKVTNFLKRHQDLELSPGMGIPIGINGVKLHKFDFGDEMRKVVVECKAHKWTEGDNVPSAKMTTWDQAMFHFYATPKRYRKLFFAIKDFSNKRNESLVEYYLRSHSHLIPSDVEVWEFDESSNTAKKMN